MNSIWEFSKSISQIYEYRIGKQKFRHTIDTNASFTLHTPNAKEDFISVSYPQKIIPYYLRFRREHNYDFSFGRMLGIPLSYFE